MRPPSLLIKPKVDSNRRALLYEKAQHYLTFLTDEERQLLMTLKGKALKAYDKKMIIIASTRVMHASLEQHLLLGGVPTSKITRKPFANPEAEAIRQRLIAEEESRE